MKLLKLLLSEIISICQYVRVIIIMFNSLFGFSKQLFLRNNNEFKKKEIIVSILRYK